MAPELSHERVAELLPWYVNSTLSSEEQALVERHLTACHTCASEVRALSRIGDAIAAGAPAAPHPAASLARTMAAIDRLERRPETWLASWASAFRNPSARFVRIALATQLAVIVVLGVAVTLDRLADPAFGTFSGAAGDSAGVRLTMMFAPTATEAAMRAVLQDVDADIVSGPSAAGVYVVRLRGPGSDAASVDRVIQKLRTNSSTVRFVEREP